MYNGTRVPRRTNILLRQVVVPRWLFMFVLVMWFYAILQLLIKNPLIAALSLSCAVTLGSGLIAWLKHRAGQPSADDDAAERKAAPSAEASAAIAWRQMCTYQVWHIALAGGLSVALLLEALGVITTP